MFLDNRRGIGVMEGVKIATVAPVVMRAVVRIYASFFAASCLIAGLLDLLD